MLKSSDETDLEFSAVGHGHLDLAWMWPIRETVRKGARTFINALRRIEDDPDYIFGASQPQLLYWMSIYYPDIYARIKNAVRAGRIETQGGFWVECDCNLSGGEALIRQAVYGQRFWKEEFGLQQEICWLPDAFGFSAALPQILSGCGMKYFSTIKLAWNKVNVFPYRIFKWQGIDGSEVLVHMPPEGDYNSMAGPAALLRARERYPEKGCGKAMLVFGAGDGGGGPQETHLEFLKREKALRGMPSVRQESALNFFRALEKCDIKSTHRGELYLETHQGTYTTQAKNKLHNRKSERLLHELESAAVIAAPYGYKMPRGKVDEIWKEVLLYQFHDILPGSSITRVYEESLAGYIETEKKLRKMISEAISCLPESEESAPVFLNLTGFRRSEKIKHDGRWLSIEAPQYGAAEAVPVKESSSALYAGENELKNGLLTLRFSKDGSVESCIDAQGHELSGKGLNHLVLWNDRFEIPFNAWDIDINYRKKPHRVLSAESYESRVDGPEAIREQVYRFGKSTIRQRVVLTEGSDTVRFETDVDWNETLRMLRAEFYPADYGNEARCEIQFGHITRPTTERDSVEKAQFEVCAHRYAAVSKDGRGFALLNNCKYGHRIKNGLISLNLLRSTLFPDKTADRGRQHFTYAFCPFRDEASPEGFGKAVAAAYALNSPLIPAKIRPFDSVFAVLGRHGSGGVVLETVKPPEDGSGIVLRLYESLGRSDEISIESALPYKSALICDMLENPIKEADLKNLHFRPFEIKTILLKQE